MGVLSRRTTRGFTLIEILTVVMIIGILATIAVNLTLSLTQRGYITKIKSDLSAAYKASVAFHSDEPDGEVTLDLLEKYGYNPTDRVVLIVSNGYIETFSLTATHPSVDGAYGIGRDGRITEP